MVTELGSFKSLSTTPPWRVWSEPSADGWGRNGL